MHVRNTVARASRSALIVLSLGIAAAAYASNRNDVFLALDEIDANWGDLSIDLWINDFENDPDPGVTVGDRLTYRVETNEPAYFVFVLVDARGSVSVLKPDARAASGISGPSRSLTFPGEHDGDSGQGIIEQAGPLGKETIYLLASDQNLPSSVFGLAASADYVDYGSDSDKLQELVAQLNRFSESGKLASARYEYFVDSDTQFSTRGIRREIVDRVEEVKGRADSGSDATDSPTPISSTPIAINDITFEFDSDTLTSKGANQLEILGSELVDRQGQNDMPRIRLTGHTDSLGPADYNMLLSEKRSLASKNFLVSEFGLPEEYIDTRGLGESAPISSNDTEAGRARNRRVDFEILQ